MGEDPRPFDRVASVVLLAVSSPVIGVAALAIKASSRGPVLHRARRAGKGCTEFTMLKLRTMRMAAADAPQIRITSVGDPRTFPVGRMLRRFKIDELPQLVNVARGEMAFVGPRPEDATIVAEHYTPFMRESLDVLPGLTSPGSLQYFAEEEGAIPGDPDATERYYLDVLLPKKIALDLVFVQNRSWRYEFGLIVRTVASLVGLRRPFAGKEAWEREQANRLLAASGATAPKSKAVPV